MPKKKLPAKEIVWEKLSPRIMKAFASNILNELKEIENENMSLEETQLDLAFFRCAYKNLNQVTSNKARINAQKSHLKAKERAEKHDALIEKAYNTLIKENPKRIPTIETIETYIWHELNKNEKLKTKRIKDYLSKKRKLASKPSQ